MEFPSQEHVLEKARDLGLLAGENPLVQRLKRLEEIIREDPHLTEIWTSLQEAEGSTGGCGSGGCGSGGG